MDYVIITPARNEAAFIEQTIKSVVAQTVLPKHWVIVSGGSTDRTEAIVESYLPRHPWIELLRIPAPERNFAAKVHSFNAGYARVKDLAWDVVANVDADVSFPADFFAYLLEQFQARPRLGVAGTDYTEGEFHSFRDSYISAQHVNGQCQLFRRACFEDIGGYVPIKSGGIDWVAVTTARMKGWETQSFSERTFEHHRQMSTAERGPLRARYYDGRKDYFLGGHPLWQLFRSMFQLTKKPYLVGGLLLFVGYASCWIQRRPIAISSELRRFHRAEQMTRLRRILAKRA